MRKNLTVMTAGIAAAMMMMTACSPRPAQTAEAATGAETTKESSVSQETKETETGAGEENQDDLQGTMDASAPLKIWGEITEVGDGVIHVDNQSENSSKGEIILTIDPENTLILDGENGFPVNYEDIQTGRFEAYLGPAMTMSLPPQSTPEIVIVNLPEDAPIAQYVVAEGAVEEKDGEKTLTANDGTEYALSEEVSIIPYLTRQMVQLEDVAEGSRCLVWLNQDEKVDRIVLFNE